ncbi:MAG: c-type cytochrome [Xanthobacteraceae bacterium]
MKLQIAAGWLVAVAVVAGSTRAQDAGVADDLREGHRLAVAVCSLCHVAAPDQEINPILRPPAPSFSSIAQRNDISADSIRKFLTTTHMDIGNATGMPNPQLLDFQIAQVTAYLLSLRKQH